MRIVSIAGACLLLLVPAGRSQDLEGLVRELGAEEFEARERAQRILSGFDPVRLPELDAVAASAVDPEIRWRLGMAIEAVAIEDLRRHHGFRGEDLWVRVHEPLGPMAIRILVLVPRGATWTSGLQAALLVRNAGGGPASIEWTEARLSGNPVEPPNEKRWQQWWRIPPIRLAPGERWRFVGYGPADRGVKPGAVFLHVVLRFNIEVEGRRIQIEVPYESHRVETRSPSEDEVAAVVAEIAALGRKDLTEDERGRLEYLFGRPEAPHRSLPGEVLRAAYERAAARDLDLAWRWFEALAIARPEEEVLAYAARRIEGGDPATLPHLAYHLPESAIPAVVALLGSPVPETRCRALDALTSREDLRGAERAVRLLDDPEARVRSRAIDYLTRIRHPCGAELARLLVTAPVGEVGRVAQALVAVGARDQVDPLIQALEREGVDGSKVLAAIGRLGGPPDVARVHAKQGDRWARGAIEALGWTGTAEDIDLVAACLDWEPDDLDVLGIDGTAIEALGRLRSVRHVSRFESEAQGGYYFGGLDGCEALDRLGTEEATDALRRIAAGAHDRRVRWTAFEILVRRMDVADAAGALGAFLDDVGNEPSFRAEAARALGKLGPEGLRVLQRFAGDPSLAVPAWIDLSRRSAPKVWARSWKFLPPIAGPVTLGSVLDRLEESGIPVERGEFDDMGMERIGDGFSAPHAYGNWLSGPRPYGLAAALSMIGECGRRDLFDACSGRLYYPHPGPVGFILTDEGLRLVPRAEAVDFHRRLAVE